jgi:hypothetical protein
METPVRLMGCVVVAIMTVLGMRVLLVTRSNGSSAPVFLRFVLHRGCIQVLHLEPIRGERPAESYDRMAAAGEGGRLPGHGGRKGVVLVLQALPNC